eukprot:jgi/Orpsp1_1/1187890/evm.model.d7180000060950.1
MVFSYPSNKNINESIKLQENNNKNNENDNIKIISNYDKNIIFKDNNDSIIKESIKQKDLKNNNSTNINISEKKNIINMNNNNNKIKINVKNNNNNNNNSNNKLKNEKFNTRNSTFSTFNNTNDSIHNKSITGNQITQNQNFIDKKKISKQITSVILKKEKDPSQYIADNINTTKSNINSNNIKHPNNEIPKRPDIKNNGEDLVRPIIKKRPPFIPSISDSKKVDKEKTIIPEIKKNKNKPAAKSSIIKHEANNSNKDNNESMTQLNGLKSTLSNSQAALIANTAFKQKKEIINKRIVKAITKYKPTIEVPTSINSINNAGTFNIYKNAHLEFCRNCLIPKDVLYFQGLILFKNISKLKEMKLTRQQINNALEWE